MIASVKIKTINKKIEPNKGQYNLDRQTAQTSTLSSGNVSKYELFDRSWFLPEKIIIRETCYN